MVRQMTFFLIVVNLVVGAGLAWAATLIPAHAARLERWGGSMMLAGLALLGVALPVFC